ncbi:MAG: aldose epimerase [Ilumatobacteraceae bacterium]
MYESDVIELRSPDGRLVVHVDPEHGGRVARIAYKDRELLVGSDHPESHHPLGWGCYPMIPFCGRVRGARLNFRNRSHALEAGAPPHAIHGTVLDRAWLVDAVDRQSVSMSIDLGDRWPFAGRARHDIEVDDRGLSLSATILAIDEMPAMIGWHPWFVKPDRTNFRPTHVLRKDHDGITTDRSIPAPDGVLDDCFEGSDELLTMIIDDVAVSLSSDCSHWVLYDVPNHATCVEPQSGPPNQVNDAPIVLSAGDSISRWFRIELDEA